MVEDTDKIKQHIDRERENLDRNLHEIEDRFKEATDWKTQFGRHTGWILGSAVAGGFLLSLALGKSSATRSRSGNWRSGVKETEFTPQARSTHPVTTHLSKVTETVDDIFAGLMAVFSDKLRSVVADAVPGFREQYDSIKHRDPYGTQRMRSTMVE